MLWLNPFVADMDLICVTSVTSSSDTCLAMSAVTGTPYFGGSFGNSECPAGADCLKPMPVPGFGVDDTGGMVKVEAANAVAVAGWAAGVACPPNARCVAPGGLQLDVAPVAAGHGHRLPPGYVLAAVGDGLPGHRRSYSRSSLRGWSCPAVAVRRLPRIRRRPKATP